MATLEKIRSKSVLLIVVIGVALLAFIVGDALTNSRNLFGDQTTVAKVGGKKIDYTEYQRKREELNNQLENLRRQNPAQYANFDTQTLAQMALDQLIAEKLIDDAVDKVGIRCTGDQLRYYVIEQQASPKMQEIIQQLQAQGIPVASASDAYNKIFNPKQNGLTDSQVAPFQRAWIAMEEDTKKLVNRQTYQRLLYNTVKSNDLDSRALYNDYVNTTNVSYAFLPFGKLDEKKYPVSDKEIQQAYNDEKYKFTVDEPTRDISVVTVSIAPSAADRKAAKELAQKALASMNDTTGNTNLSKELRKEGVTIENRAVRGSDISKPAVKEFVASAAPGTAQIVTENTQGFTIVKMGKRQVEVDSVQISIVNVLGKNLPSKVLASLNGGVPTDSITNKFGNDSVMVQPAQWVPLYTSAGRTQALSEDQLNTLMNANGQYVALMEEAQGSTFAKITDRSKTPKDIYEFQEVNYALVPSQTTINDERAKLEKFLAANNTSAKFNENAAKAGYTVQTVSVNQSTPALPRMMAYNQYYPNSRQVIRWVMIDGKKGEVSQIFDSKEVDTPMLYAVAIDDVYDEYVSPSNADLKKYLTDKVRRSKAGDALVKQYQPKAGTLASASAAMGVESRNDSTFRFGRGNRINDAHVMGRINGANADKKVVVMKGDDGVYVYQINGKGKEDFPYDAKQYEQQYFQLVNPDLITMLKGSRKVKNNAYKFEAAAE